MSKVSAILPDPEDRIGKDAPHSLIRGFNPFTYHSHAASEIHRNVSLTQDQTISDALVLHKPRASSHDGYSQYVIIKPS